MRSNYKIVFFLLFVFYSTIAKSGLIDYVNTSRVVAQINSLVQYEKTSDAQSTHTDSIQSMNLIRLKNDISNLYADALESFISRNYQKAIPQILQIIEYIRINSSNEYLQLANWQKLLGNAYMYIGDYHNSEKYYISALEILENHNLQKEKAFRMILDAFSVLYLQIQNYDKANLLNGKAKIMYEEALDFGDDYVRCLSNGALIQNELGYKTLAKIQIDVALRQAKKNLYDTIAISPSLESLYLPIERKPNTSSIDNDYFIETRIRPYTTFLSNSSVIYSNLGYFADAVRSIKESILLSEKYDLKEAIPYNNLGMLYLHKSKFPQSVEWFLKSYQLCKTPYESDEVGMNATLGLYLSNDSIASSFCSGVSDRMRKNIQNMFTFMSGEERAIYWKHFEYYLPLLNLIIYESGDSTEYGTIYNNILESKGLLLRSTNDIRDAILNSGDENDIANFMRISKLKQQLLTETDENIRTNILKEIEKIDKYLTEHVNTYANFTTTKSVRWENVRDALSYKDLAIEFYNIPIVWRLDSGQMYAEPRYCAVVLKKKYEYPHIIPLCKKSCLDSLNQEDYYETDSMYNLIWKPLEEELKGVQNIYFSADRELHKIGIEYTPMPFDDIIGDKYNIYRLSSTRIIVENHAERRNDNAVLYGGLRYDIEKDDLIAESHSGNYHPTSTSRAVMAENKRYGVKYLPGTLKEIEDISQNFKNRPRLITDTHGTEESFKSLAGSSIDIIHLATHGFFWNEEDIKKRDYVTFLRKTKKQQFLEDKALMHSGLFFSGANLGLKGESLPDDVEDGILTALELSNINLGHVDMVVMSACESGLGETFGDGVFGLQRGFKLAGAKTLLMSLWKVDDEATQILMTEFYKNYLNGMSKRESLLAAQKAVRKTPGFEDPKYWAAFILLDGLN